MRFGSSCTRSIVSPACSIAIVVALDARDLLGDLAGDDLGAGEDGAGESVVLALVAERRVRVVRRGVLAGEPVLVGSGAGDCATDASLRPLRGVLRRGGIRDETQNEAAIR